MSKAIAFVARLSGTGKTTLVEAVIRILAARGYRVGAIKHDAHDFEIDKPGKDSYRFTAAGAATTVVASRRKTAVVRQNPDAPKLEFLLDSYCRDLDVVLVEGFKGGSLPKIEVHRQGFSPSPTLAESGALSQVVAIACDGDCSETGLPHLDLNDPEAVADFVLQHARLI
ncbi:molybdopterin-guanine dinucleotide biosynthesis protein B [Pelobacter seleniigenes]|uniref:molybdopterin-guanine dinucleotide biosynthesis protein B n=1 Tax=Pelobacter seleniigenes TaxID=407188 RepID=UPI0004A6CBA2|nr:molybdopterin-guanine dinucleotide biosynthesis protein B [Pelobacter seleniigenes]